MEFVFEKVLHKLQSDKRKKARPRPRFPRLFHAVAGVDIHPAVADGAFTRAAALLRKVFLLKIYDINMPIRFVYRPLIRTFELRSNVLALG